VSICDAPGKFLENCKPNSNQRRLLFEIRYFLYARFVSIPDNAPDNLASGANYSSHCYRALILLRVSSIDGSVYLPSSFHRLRDSIFFPAMPKCDHSLNASAHGYDRARKKRILAICNLWRFLSDLAYARVSCSFPFLRDQWRPLKKSRAGCFLDTVQIRNRVLQRGTARSL